MKEKNRTGKRCRAAAIVFLLCGLTACANPLTAAVETALNNFNETADEAYNENIEIRELEVRKIEPDSYLLEESSEIIEDESVPLETVTAEHPFP